MSKKIAEVMTKQFSAHMEGRSWGDRLANKWNFAIPGLPEAVEVHAKRLGQTGEHRQLAERFVSRRVEKVVNGFSFPVPAPEERIIVATLQRMYRHFYFRVMRHREHGRVARICDGELRRTETSVGIRRHLERCLQLSKDRERLRREISGERPESSYRSAAHCSIRR